MTAYPPVMVDAVAELLSVMMNAADEEVSADASMLEMAVLPAFMLPNVKALSPVMVKDFKEVALNAPVLLAAPCETMVIVS